MNSIVEDKDIEGGSLESKQSEIPPNLKNSHVAKLCNSFQLPNPFKDVCRASLYQLRFAVFCASVNSRLLTVNFPFMVGKDHPDAFPNTKPFDFNSATYFIPMCSMLGIAIASTFVGKLSDHVGRKR
eukprot:14572920-Ditylum_brightwellii.AAC.1